MLLTKDVNSLVCILIELILKPLEIVDSKYKQESNFSMHLAENVNRKIVNYSFTINL